MVPLRTFNSPPLTQYCSLRLFSRRASKIPLRSVTSSSSSVGSDLGYGNSSDTIILFCTLSSTCIDDSCAAWQRIIREGKQVQQRMYSRLEMCECAGARRIAPLSEGIASLSPSEYSFTPAHTPTHTHTHARIICPHVLRQTPTRTRILSCATSHSSSCSVCGHVRTYLDFDAPLGKVNQSRDALEHLFE